MILEYIAIRDMLDTIQNQQSHTYERQLGLISLNYISCFSLTLLLNHQRYKCVLVSFVANNLRM